MEYLTGAGHETRPPIDGGILQGAVSDRESIVASMDPKTYQQSCKAAQELVDAGDGDEVLSSKLINKFFPAPVSAKRWLSLASPNHDGDDDYFSSDLTDEQLLKTFGKLPARAPICVLFSGADEYMPKNIDVEAVTKRWIEIAKKGEGRVDEEYSGTVEGATHNLSRNKPEVVERLVKRVLGFLNSLSAQSNL